MSAILKEHAFVVFVVNKHDLAIPGAEVAVLINGTKLASATLRGYQDSPIRVQLSEAVTEVTLVATVHSSKSLELRQAVTQTHTVAVDVGTVSFKFPEVGMPQPPTPRGPDTRFFVVGCILLAAAIGFLAWGFSLPPDDLTVQRQAMLTWILALAGGFAVGAFTGAVTIRSRGVWPGLAATATGGFAVWLITFYYLFPTAPVISPQTFSAPAIVHREGRTGDRKGINGTLALDVAGLQPIAVKDGHGTFQFVPQQKANTPLRFAADLPGFAVADPDKPVVLSADVPVYVAVREVRVDEGEPRTATPAPPTQPNMISVSIGKALSLAGMVKHLASITPDATITFSKSCKANVKNAQLPPGTYTAASLEQFLTDMKSRVDGTPPIYDVRKSGSIRYEIVCP